MGLSKHFIGPPVSPDARWLHLFGAFDFIAVAWTLVILSHRIDLVSESRDKAAKRSAFRWLALLPVGYLILCLL